MEHRRQLFDKIPEVDSSVRRKEENDFIPVKGIFSAEKLHRTLELLYFLKTDFVG